MMFVSDVDSEPLERVAANRAGWTLSIVKKYCRSLERLSNLRTGAYRMINFTTPYLEIYCDSDSPPKAINFCSEVTICS